MTSSAAATGTKDPENLALSGWPKFSAEGRNKAVEKERRREGRRPRENTEMHACLCVGGDRWQAGSRQMMHDAGDGEMGGYEKSEEL